MRLSASRGAPPKRVTRTSRQSSIQPIAEQLPLCRRQDASCLAEQCLQRDGVYRGPFSRRCRVGSSVWGVGAGRNGEGGEYRVAHGLGSPVNADAPDVLHLGALEQRRSQKPAPAPGVHVGQAAVRTNNLKPPSPVAGLRQDIAHHQSVQRSFSTTSALVARINAATQSLTAILSITAFLSQLPNEWANWRVRVSVVPDRLKQLVANLENRVFRRLLGGLTAKTLLTRSSGSVCPVRRAG
jgi:hypothetical protein